MSKLLGLMMLRSLFVLFVVSALSSKAGAATLDDGARAEGEVVLYRSLNNAGKLLIGFILSVDGQRMLRDQGRIPAHRDVDPQVFSLRNVKLQASDPRLAKDHGAAGEEMRAIFGTR